MSEGIRRHLHEANRLSWNAATRVHNQHKRDQAAWLRQGGEMLFPEELELLDELAGKRLVHLQCNSGQDSLCLARRGAEVTGVDISDEAIEFARELSRATGISATFERADIYDWLPRAALDGRRFDLAFCSYGALCWLSDLRAWARGVAELLEPGGALVVVEFHPLALCFDEQFQLSWSYFGASEGEVVTHAEGVGDYVGYSGDGLAPMGLVEPGAAGSTANQNPHPAHEFMWTIADRLQALVEAGLAIERYEEYPYSNGCKLFDDMVLASNRRFVMPPDRPAFPLMYGLRARKPSPASEPAHVTESLTNIPVPQVRPISPTLGMPIATITKPPLVRTGGTVPHPVARAAKVSVPIYQVDAFADGPFTGNPAAVCLLERWFPEAHLLAIAAENNLSETAFLVREGDRWRIRWFTPVTEVNLCGHATLASAHVIFTELEWPHAHVVFESRSGQLPIRRDYAGKIVMDFPARPAEPVRERPRSLVEALGGIEPVELYRSDYWMAVFRNEQEIAQLRPDFRTLARTVGELIVTAPGGPANPGMDFVSRFFGPGVGIDEDPVTGSAHCILTPYWAKRLGKAKLKGRQISARGGIVECELAGKRVELGGYATLVMVGELRV